ARPTGVFCRRSQPAKVARVWSSSSIRSADLRPCMASSRLGLCRKLWQISIYLSSFSAPFHWGLVLSISRVLHVSRPTIDWWLQRFEAEHVAGLDDKSSSPQTTTRKAWFPLMIAIYH